MDLGCGNGLLCYILSLEGVGEANRATSCFRSGSGRKELFQLSGVGVDVRRRGVWDMYGREGLLEERTLDLRLETDADATAGIPETAWLIGNHSDELTPWIPLLSARLVLCSSPHLPALLHWASAAHWAIFL